ncbi:MAG TPA: hypothetical protein VIV40_26905 [Kofleriaceae bacterium]
MRRVSVLVSVLLSTSTALAQPSDHKALAEQLFNQGRELAKAKDWTAACPKFEASLRYDPALGTKLNLATCYEHIGKLASAWGLYRDSAELAAKAGDAKRREYALTQANALEPRLPKLTITVPARAPSGFAVTRDGTPVEPAAFGSALYVDPGKHAITAAAPGFKALTKTITIDEAKSETVAIPALEAAPPQKSEHDKEYAPRGKPIEAAPSKRKLVGLGIAAGGVVLTGVGAVFGVKASSTFDSAKTLCGDNLACGNDADYDRGKKLISDAREQATLSTVFFIAGGAAIATGVVLWVTAPRTPRAETARLVPAVGSRSVGVTLVGGF